MTAAVINAAEPIGTDALKSIFPIKSTTTHARIKSLINAMLFSINGITNTSPRKASPVRSTLVVITPAKETLKKSPRTMLTMTFVKIK